MTERHGEQITEVDIWLMKSRLWVGKDNETQIQYKKKFRWQEYLPCMKNFSNFAHNEEEPLSSL